MLGIIGGTGIYQIEDLEILDEIELTTPFGKPSAALIKAKYKDNLIWFLPRHGTSHNLMPHEVNYRANIYALKKAGVTRIIGISAVGSLREEYAPGDFVIPEHYIDNIKSNREKSFFGDGLVAHVSTAQTTCPILTSHIKSIDNTIHTGATYVCVDGPRLGTIAESHYFRDAMKADLVGMTNVPEAFLAKEAQIDYCTIGIVTDYDCWRDEPSEHVTVQDVIKRFGNSIERAKDLLREILDNPLPEQNQKKRKHLESALLTPKECLSAQKLELLEVLSS